MAEYDLADGTVLTNASLSVEAEKNSVAIIDAGDLITGTKIIDFSVGGCYKCNASGTVGINASGLGVGQTGIVHILSLASAPTLTFTGVGIWVSSTAPTFTANKLTVVTLFNDGTRIVGSFLKEA
jgi:hypothetical protein